MRSEYRPKRGNNKNKTYELRNYLRLWKRKKNNHYKWFMVQVRQYKCYGFISKPWVKLRLAESKLQYFKWKLQIMKAPKKRYRPGENPTKTEGRLVIDRKPIASTKRAGKHDYEPLPDIIKPGEKPLPF